MNKRTVDDIKVGDVVWYTDINASRLWKEGYKEVVVKKVGRELITVDDGWRGIVFRKDTLQTNDKYRHQTLIPDLKAYKEQQTKYKIAQKIVSQSTYHLGKLDIKNIKTAAELLGIDITDIE